MNAPPHPQLPLNDDCSGIDEENGSQGPDEICDRESCQDDEPEPKEDVDLLIDYVDGQDTLK